MNSAGSDKQFPAHDATRARQLARRLIDRDGAGQGDAAGAHAAAACGDLYRDLSRSIGLDGCQALFARALAVARTEHPLLDEVNLRPRSEPYVEGVTETVDAYGPGQTAEAIEAILVRLIELLGRLIGEDMAMQLIEDALAKSARDRGHSPRRRAEA